MFGIITLGVAGCGKVEWAMSQDADVILVEHDSVDDIVEYLETSVQFYEDRRLIVVPGMISQSDLGKIVNCLEEIGYESKIKYFHGFLSKEDIQLEKCIENSKQRAIDEWNFMHQEYDWLVKSDSELMK